MRGRLDVAADPSSRDRLLAAAIDVIRVKGYAATRVDDIAAAAGVTKGSFFHHFATKEACAREAAVFWSVRSRDDFAGASRDSSGPAQQQLAYIDFRISLLAGPASSYACYVGTVLQEVHDTHPQLAAESAASILGQAIMLEDDLRAALGSRQNEAHDLAVYIESTIQGALLFAKAEGDTTGARTTLAILRHFLETRLERQP
jgi:TetR/AcrR family transcriptional regulator, transcriptional repressor for nem operon